MQLKIKNNIIFKALVVLFFMLLFQTNTRAQEQLTIPPLFEYPVPPDDLESLSDRCNYLAVHFWDSFDFNKKQAVDQNALNHAFNVWITAVIHSETTVGLPAVDKLIDKLSKNPNLLTQFGKAAEENLYGPRADFWQDDLYLKFTDALASNKKVLDVRREKYKKQGILIRNSKVGSKMPEFEFQTVEGEKKNYFPMSTPSMIIFGNPGDIDWRMSRMKLDTDLALNQAIEKGKVNVIFISTTDNPSWKGDVENYSSRWSVGMNSDIKQKIDLRGTQTVFLIGADGFIKARDIAPERGMVLLLNEVK